MMHTAKISFLGQHTLYHIWKAYHLPAVHNREIRCGHYFDNGERLDLVSDGKCDSPGYNVKYRTYTLMN